MGRTDVSTAVRGGARTRSRPILVVDDDPLIRELLEEVLTDAGFAVVLAEDGEDALRAMNGAPPRLLLLDIQMPKVDGPSLVRELRQRLSDLPVIVMTARPRPGHEADRCNAVASLAKPFDIEEVVRLVRRFAR